MFDLAGILGNAINALSTGVSNALTSAVSGVGKSIEDAVVRPITSEISLALNSLQSGLSALESAASNGVANAISTTTQALVSTESAATSGFTRALSAVSSGVSNVGSAIGATLENAVTGINSGFSAIVHGVADSLNATGGVIHDALLEVGKLEAATFLPVMEGITHFLEQLPADIETIAKEVSTGIGKVGATLDTLEAEMKQFVETKTNALETTIKKFDIQNYGKEFAGSFVGYIDKELKLATGLDFSKMDPLAVGRIYGVFEIFTTLGLYMEFFPSMAFVMQGILNELEESALIGSYRNLRQVGNAGTPNEILSTTELIAARYKKSVTDDDFYDQMARGGYSPEQADKIYSASRSVLSVGELVALYKRGKLGDLGELYTRALEDRATKSQVDGALSLYDKLLGVSEAVTLWRRNIVPEGWTDAFDDLRREGITEERIEAIKRTSVHLPTVFQWQDFVARKVDDEEHVQKFGLDYGIDEEYMKLARADGWDDTNAKRIYRSYWQLPPFFLLAAEYKAGKIPEQDLRDALAFERYTPYWIDRFVENLKPTFTLGDVKDLYKYQAINAAEIPKHLKEIGMSDALAEQYKELWQATVKLASPLDSSGSAHAATKIKDDTESLIKTAYKDGILTKDVAKQKLKDIGVVDEASTLILSIADYEVTQKTIKDTFQDAKDNVLAGNMTINEAINALSTAGATTKQLDLYNAELQRSFISKPKMPTLAEFVAWHKHGIIDDGQLANGLSLIGWSDTWIPFFLAQAGVSTSKIDTLYPNLSSPI